MKRILATSALLVLAAAAQAQDTKYINADGSPASELCIAALESHNAVFQKASELKINDFNYERLSCNNVSVYQWVRKHQTAATPAATETKSISFAISPADNTLETELCVAAATAPKDFERLQKSAGLPLEKLRCNGTQLKQFVQRYSMLDQ